MTTILRIQSGGNLQGSATRQIGQMVIEQLRTKHPGSRLIERDLVLSPIPHISPQFVGTMFSDNDEKLQLSNQMIDELFASDVIVMESPMYNFGIPSVLKAWIDHVVRARKTFRISATGAEGMLVGKKAVLVLGSGGVYSDGPFKALDFQEGYLRATLGFIGITDLEVVRIEGLNLGPEMAARAMASARQRVGQMLSPR